MSWEVRDAHFTVNRKLNSGQNGWIAEREVAIVAKVLALTVTLWAELPL
jgi:hypothetical protein